MSARHRGRQAPPRDETALAALDGAPVVAENILDDIRKASGMTYKQLGERSGYAADNHGSLRNPSLRKAIDIAGAMGFDLVLRRRA